MLNRFHLFLASSLLCISSAMWGRAPICGSADVKVQPSLERPATAAHAYAVPSMAIGAGTGAAAGAAPVERKTKIEEKALKLPAGRVIRIYSYDESGISHLVIEDSEGPSEKSQYALWQYARVIERPSDSKTWVMIPDAEAVRELRQQEGPGPGIYHRGKPRLYELPPYGSPLRVHLRSNTLSGFEYLSLLREEPLVLANIDIDHFVKDHFKSLVLPYREARKLTDPCPRTDFGNLIHPIDEKFDRTFDQVFNIEKYIHPHLSEVERRSLLFDEKDWKNLRKQEDELARRILYRRGYVPPIKPLISFDAPQYESTLIVVHAHDICMEPPVVGCIDNVVAKFKARKLPVFYLMTGETQKIQYQADWAWDTDMYGDRWMLKDRQPTAALFSAEGIHTLVLPTKDIVIVGAYWAQCHLHATLDAIQGHFDHSEAPVNIHFPLGAIREASSEFSSVEDEFAFGPIPDNESFCKHKARQFFDESFGADRKKTSEGRPGTAVAFSDYSFRVFCGATDEDVDDDVEIETFGTGPRVVNLRFWIGNIFEEQVISKL
jgi:hypothetical protein